MFSRLSPDGRRRRILSPSTLTASVGAHVLLLGGVLMASDDEPRPVPTVEPPIYWVEPEPERLRPDPPALEPLRSPEHPDVPVPRGEPVVMPDPPVEIPTVLPNFSPSDSPIRPDQVDGIGVPGSPDGDPDVRPTPGAPTAPAGGGGRGDAPYEESAVEERPALRNAAEMQRVLQRLYPELLRESGIAGHSRIELVIDAEGRVEPGSVTVVSTSHPAFEAPSVRAAERFRFRPAKVGGRAVRVVVTLPITWAVAPS